MRRRQIVEANIAGTHAYQCLLAAASEKADQTAWSASGMTTNDLEALVRHQGALLSEKPGEIRGWVEGRVTAFDPAQDLIPIAQSPLKAAATNLPVNILAAWLRARTGAADLEARAVASLLQTQLDVTRDADRLQDLYALYQALGLPVHTARLGMTARTDAEFLALAQEVAPRFCAGPFDADDVTLRLMFRKMWNWGHRYTGERDKGTVARELLREPEVAALVPKLRALPAQKIAVIGHSYTMNMHWSSPSASVPIAAEVLAQIGAPVEVRQWQAGGMTASRADCQRFHAEALAWRPDRALIVVSAGKPADLAALDRMLAGFAAAGVKVAMFDSLYGKLRPGVVAYPAIDWMSAAARRTGLELIPVEEAINAAPDRDTFLALDAIHMTEPYHRLLAKAWLRYLAAASVPGMADRESIERKQAR